MTDYRDLLPTTETISLKFKQFAATVLVAEDAFLFDNAEVQVQREAFGQLAYRLRTRVLTDDLPPEEFTAQARVTFEVPASTWQMWKKRHAASWYAWRLVTRWPVRYEPDPDERGTIAVCTASLERWRAYPQAKVQVPADRFGSPVLFHAIRDLRWDYSPTRQGRRPS